MNALVTLDRIKFIEESSTNRNYIEGIPLYPLRQRREFWYKSKQNWKAMNPPNFNNNNK